jgi:hypothetical protein
VNRSTELMMEANQLRAETDAIAKAYNDLLAGPDSHNMVKLDAINRRLRQIAIRMRAIADEMRDIREGKRPNYNTEDYDTIRQ